MQKNAFTLLEIIIVVIIIGVLASLALPRLVSTIEFSRSSEALSALTALRSSVERCYLFSSSYLNCNTFANIDLTNPSQAPGAHFTYAWVNVAANAYTLQAGRNTVDGGSTASFIQLIIGTGTVTRSGGSAFSGIK